MRAIRAAYKTANRRRALYTHPAEAPRQRPPGFRNSPRNFFEGGVFHESYGLYPGFRG
jgi:hypothetical protein